MNSHWSYNALTVKIAGVNAVVTIPLLLLAINPASIAMLMVFLFTTIFFVVVENVMGLKAQYFLYALRFKLIGPKRTPKSNNFDI